MGEADDLFAQLDRMAEQIEGADHHRAAEEELISELDGLGNDPGYRSRSPEEEAELRLRELKRRMGKE